jgi:hypothetical protein
MLVRFISRGGRLAVLAGLSTAVWALSVSTTNGQVITRQGAKNIQAFLAPIKTQLQQAKHLLHTADHDYGGHRVKALAALNKGIHALNHHGSKARLTQVPGQAKPPGQVQPGNALPQATSDAQLKQAAQIINTALTQLATLPANSRVNQAAPHLQQAIGEIQQALNFIQQQQLNRQPPLKVVP